MDMFGVFRAVRIFQGIPTLFEGIISCNVVGLKQVHSTQALTSTEHHI